MKATTPAPAFVIFGDGTRERQRHAPANFWHWTEKARVHWLRRRWPRVRWAWNGRRREFTDSQYMRFPAPK